MTKRIIALTGKPGCGKTHYYKEHLFQFPLFDVADIYLAFPEYDPHTAFTELLVRISEALKELDTVVVEAAFRAGSFQRTWLENLGYSMEAHVSYIDLDQSTQICIQRVKSDAEAALKGAQSDAERGKITQRYQARMNMLTGVW